MNTNEVPGASRCFQEAPGASRIATEFLRKNEENWKDDERFAISDGNSHLTLSTQELVQH